MLNLVFKAITSEKQIKTILSVLAIIIIIIVVFFVGRKIIKRLNADTIVKNSDINKKDLTLTDTEYRQIVSVIKEAVNGLGTDEETIYRSLKRLGSKADFLKIISLYGTDSDDYNLPARLIYELDTTEQKKVNDILSKIDASI